MHVCPDHHRHLMQPLVLTIFDHHHQHCYCQQVLFCLNDKHGHDDHCHCQALSSLWPVASTFCLCLSRWLCPLAKSKCASQIMSPRSEVNAIERIRSTYVPCVRLSCFDVGSSWRYSRWRIVRKSAAGTTPPSSTCFLSELRAHFTSYKHK